MSISTSTVIEEKAFWANEINRLFILWTAVEILSRAAEEYAAEYVATMTRLKAGRV